LDDTKQLALESLAADMADTQLDKGVARALNFHSLLISDPPLLGSTAPWAAEFEFNGVQRRVIFPGGQRCTMEVGSDALLWVNPTARARGAPLHTA
jgi:hypothetical protein